MQTKKDIARKLIETIFYEHVRTLIKNTSNPMAVLNLFKTWAELGKFNIDLISKAVTYFIQVSEKFDLSKTAVHKMCMILDIPYHKARQLKYMQKSTYFKTKRERIPLLNFVEKCQGAHFSYAADEVLANFLVFILSNELNADPDVLDILQTLLHIMEDPTDEQFEI